MRETYQKLPKVDRLRALVNDIAESSRINDAQVWFLIWNETGICRGHKKGGVFHDLPDEKYEKVLAFLLGVHLCVKSSPRKEMDAHILNELE